MLSWSAIVLRKFHGLWVCTNRARVCTNPRPRWEVWLEYSRLDQLLSTSPLAVWRKGSCLMIAGDHSLVRTYSYTLWSIGCGCVYITLVCCNSGENKRPLSAVSLGDPETTILRVCNNGVITLAVMCMFIAKLESCHMIVYHDFCLSEFVKVLFYFILCACSYLESCC